MREDFAVFIITYKRPNSQLTYDALKRCNYTGKIYFVVDNTDETIQQYIDNYGVKNVMVFDKNHYINSDEYDNGTNKAVFATALYARRAVEDIAHSFGLNVFVMADDDISDFIIRCPINNKLHRFPIKDFDTVLNLYFDLLQDNVACVGFGMNRSYFGGVGAFSPERLSKKVIPSNFFIRNANIPVKWTAWTFEDDITQYCSASDGVLWFSVPYIQQISSAFADVSGSGGNVELYQTSSHYEVCFTEVQYVPSAIKVKCKSLTDLMSVENTALIRQQNNCFQKLVSDKYRRYV